MRQFSRREFFTQGAKAGAAMGMASILAGCPAGSPPSNPTTQTARVAAVRGANLYTMARDALAAFGGTEAWINPGETVFIKPNFGAFGMVKYNPFQAGDATKPEIVIAVAEECLKAGAGEVIIGEAGQAYRFSWSEVVTLDGATNMAAEAARLEATYSGKVTLACLNSDSPDFDRIPSYSKLRLIRISSLVSRADRIISIPVIKTHRWTQITASMKNFVGVTSTEHYGFGIQWRFLLHDAGIEQCFLDIVNALRPDFAIIDASICCEGNGPHVMPGYWGTTVDMRDRLGDWLLLASNDLAAADATAARVISHDVDQIRHLNMAYDMGLGQIKEDKITLDGATLDELKVPWQPAEQTEGFAEVIIPGIHLIT